MNCLSLLNWSNGMQRGGGVQAALLSQIPLTHLAWARHSALPRSTHICKLWSLPREAHRQTNMMRQPDARVPGPGQPTCLLLSTMTTLPVASCQSKPHSAQLQLFISTASQR